MTRIGSNVHFGAAVGIYGTSAENVKQVLQPGVKVIDDQGQLSLNRGDDSILLKPGTDRDAAEDIVKAVEKGGVRAVIGNISGVLSEYHRKYFEALVSLFSMDPYVGKRGDFLIEDNLMILLEKMIGANGKKDQKTVRGSAAKTAVTTLDSYGQVEKHET